MPELPGSNRLSLRLQARPFVATAASAVLAVAGCTSNTVMDDPPASSDPNGTIPSAPSATAPPSATPRPTREPTPRPTPEPEADLARSDQVVYAWQNEFSDYVSYQVIIEITNEGDGWAEILAFNSDYQVLDSNGGLVTTGNFLYAFPEFVGPGETAFLLADGIEEGVSPDAFATVEADGRYDLVDEPETTFTFEDVQLRQHDFESGYYATGFVTASHDVQDAAIAVVCIDAQGVPLGTTWTNLVQNLSSGERKGFETVGATPPLDPSHCAELRGVAEDTGF